MIVKNIETATCAAIGCAALSLAVSPAQAGPTIGACTPSAARYIVSDAKPFRTTSTDFVDLGQASVTFTQGGTKESCVILRFSAQPKGSSGHNIVVQALLDGATTAIPAAVQLSDGNDLSNGVHSYNFIFPSVSPGNHTVKMQFVALNGGNVDMNLHAMVVQYVP